MYHSAGRNRPESVSLGHKECSFCAAPNTSEKIGIAIILFVFADSADFIRFHMFSSPCHPGSLETALCETGCIVRSSYNTTSVLRSIDVLHMG